MDFLKGEKAVMCRKRKQLSIKTKRLKLPLLTRKTNIQKEHSAHSLK